MKKAKEGEAMVSFAVIADDLTGANDTAVQFAKRGVGTSVQIDMHQEVPKSEGSRVVVVNTDSRDLSAADAYRVVKEAARHLQAEQVQTIYKKMDSTLRGNFAAEIAAVADVYQPEAVFIAPAYPRAGRMTVGGYHFLDGLPLEFTEIAHAPKTPVQDSYIPALIEEQTGRTAAVISLSVIKKGREAVAREVASCQKQGISWFIFDVVQEEDFLTIRQGTEAWPSALWAGSAGLADFLTASPELADTDEAGSGRRSGPVLIVAGSVSEKTHQQMQEVTRRNARLIKLPGEKVLTEDGFWQDCAAQVKQALAEGWNVLLATSESQQDVTAAVAAGSRAGLSGRDVSEQLAVVLGRIVAQLDMTKLSGMVLTGGDTAVHVLKTIGARYIEVVAEVATGIPLGKLHGGTGDGLWVVTKAGAFGQRDCFIAALNAIHGKA
ncbi:four-carbon acid sugar kinase family protein [Selenomonas ruminantium]|nr:four-carbon acid sugar kinase family protein [Selenomonas ruminantium]